MAGPNGSITIVDHCPRHFHVTGGAHEKNCSSPETCAAVKELLVVTDGEVVVIDGRSSRPWRKTPPEEVAAAAFERLGAADALMFR